MIRTVTLCPVMVITVVATSLSIDSSSTVHHKRSTNSTSSRNQSKTTSQWRLLWLLHEKASKATLRIDRRQFQKPGLGPRLEEGKPEKTQALPAKIVISTTDSHTLALLSAFPGPMLRYAMPDDGTAGGGWGGGGEAFAVLDIEVGKEKFTIGVTRVGFALNSGAADYSNVFFSASLAAWIDELYYKKTGVHFSKSMMKTWSGQSHIERQLTWYKAVRARQKAKK